MVAVVNQQLLHERLVQRALAGRLQAAVDGRAQAGEELHDLVERRQHLAMVSLQPGQDFLNLCLLLPNTVLLRLHHVERHSVGHVRSQELRALIFEVEQSPTLDIGLSLALSRVRVQQRLEVVSMQLQRVGGWEEAVRLGCQLVGLINRYVRRITAGASVAA